MRPRRYAERHTYADHLLFGAAFTKEAMAPFAPLYQGLKAMGKASGDAPSAGADTPPAAHAQGPVAKRVGADVHFNIKRPQDWVMFRMMYGAPGRTGRVALDPPPDGKGP